MARSAGKTAQPAILLGVESVRQPPDKRIRSDARMVRASASRAVGLGLISSPVKPMTLKLVFTASLLDAQH